MRRTPYLEALVALALIFLAACDSKSDKPGLNKLAEDFRTANQANTIQPMLALYHTEGSDERTLSLLKGALKYELGLKIRSIQFEPLSGAPEETIDFVHDGVAYGPSLTPRMRMQVIYESDDGFTSLFTVGQAEKEHWRIVCAKPIIGPPPSLSHTPTPR